MNSLSMLLYLADVLTGVSQTIIILSLASLLASAVIFFGSLSCTENIRDTMNGSAGNVRWIVPLACFMLVIVNLVPSKTTFYMIAASEVGEDVLKTPEITKVRRLINQSLDEALAPKKESE